MSKKIARHVDKEEIVRRLNDGESVRKVSAWLKEKYATNKSLQLSTVTLQAFRKKHLQLEGKVLKDIQESSEVQRRAIDEQQRIAALEATNSYQDKINEIADTHLDVSRKILQLDTIIEHRMEYWFNALVTGEATPSAADKEMRQWMDRQMLLLGQYKKFVEGLADHTVEHRVNVTVMNEQVSVIRDVIRDIISGFDPDTALLFIEKVSSKLGALDYDAPPESPMVDNKLLTAVEAEILEDYDE